jgi:peroxiredoxin
MKGQVTSMKHKLSVIAGIIIGVTILTVGAFEAWRNPQPQTAGPSAGLQMKIAPDFSLTSLDGRSKKLSDYRGTVVLLNFWATWCAPCRVEMPTLADLYNKYHAQGLEIVGVSLDDFRQERVARFVSEMKINYPILLGNQSVADLYGGGRLLPQTVFITRDGEILQTMIGMRDRKEFEAAIEQLLLTKPHG